MSKQRDMNISLICYAMVSSMFAMFTNEKYHGPNFSWDTFPEMMGEHCESTIFIHMVSKNVKEEHEVRRLAKSFGTEIASTLVNRMQ